MMASRTDILDQPERLRKPFLGSVLLHVSLAAAMLAGTWVQGRRSREPWGDIHGGGMGSVAVNVVPRIALPTQGGALNPVANDTESRVPTPPAKTRPAPKTQAPEPDAIPIPSRNAQKQASRPSSGPNKFREAQKDAPNQMYSDAGQRMVSPMVGMSGGGGVGVGTNSPFGTRFGAYTNLVRNQVARSWRTGDIDPRIRTANPVIVTFRIMRDGSVPFRSVRITQTSGISALDLSAQRAIMEAAPFGPLPPQWGGSDVEVEFWFTLRR